MRTETTKFYKSIRAARIAATMLKKNAHNKRIEVFRTPVKLKSGNYKRDRKTGAILCAPAVYIITI